MSTPGSTQYQDDWYQWAADKIGDYLKAHKGPFNYKLPVVSDGDRNAAWQLDWDSFLSGRDVRTRTDADYYHIRSDEDYGHGAWTTDSTGQVQYDSTGLFDTFSGDQDSGYVTRFHGTFWRYIGVDPNFWGISYRANLGNRFVTKSRSTYVGTVRKKRQKRSKKAA